MTSVKDLIHEIEDASDEMLGGKSENHLEHELLKDLLSKAMTPEEVQAIEDKYINHFKEDEILKIIHDAKLEKGFVRD